MKTDKEKIKAWKDCVKACDEGIIFMIVSFSLLLIGMILEAIF